ncbi:MAG TPA: ABC transporter ATP-binding protein [Candidatus Eisenbacteria bacterium]|nr:ABC transporter ATP-binding protein [Candidatus Eisenbacteria bacterium]
MAGEVIEIKDLRFRYKHREVLSGVSFSVKKGEVFGFIGPNGAGKSTTIKAMIGLLFPESGTIRIHGMDPADPAMRRKIGYLPEEASYYRFLTPLEILRFYGSVSGMDGASLKRRSGELLELVGMAEFRNKQVGTFSKGMAQKISLAQALLHDPETLILDEPTSGLDPIAKSVLRDLLKTLAERGKTIFFSSHELSEVALLCDAISIIKAGKVVLSGPIGKVVGAGDQNLEKLFIRLVKGEEA